MELAAVGTQVDGGSGFLTNVNEGVLVAQADPANNVRLELDGTRGLISLYSDDENSHLVLGDVGNLLQQSLLQYTRTEDNEPIAYLQVVYLPTDNGFVVPLDQATGFDGSLDQVLRDPDNGGNFAGVGGNVTNEAGVITSSYSVRASSDNLFDFAEIEAVADDLDGTSIKLSADTLDIIADPTSLARYARGALTGGFLALAANSNTGTAVFDVAGLSVSPTVLSGRKYRISCGFHGVRSTVAGDDVQVSIWDGAGNRLAASGRITVGTANSGCEGRTITYIDQPGATGAKTYKVRCERVTGTGTVGLSAATDLQTYILVEDVGP